MSDIMSRFVILEDPTNLTWTVFHEAGFAVGDNFPTYEDAFAAMVSLLFIEVQLEPSIPRTATERNARGTKQSCAIKKTHRRFSIR